MSSDGLVVYGFLAIMATFGGTGSARADGMQKIEEGVYCPKVAPLLVAKWEKQGQPKNFLLHHGEDFTLVSIERTDLVTSISLRGDFRGEIEDIDSDGIIDKLIGGGWGSSYDSSLEKSGLFSPAQARYEKECEALWPLLQPPGQ